MPDLTIFATLAGLGLSVLFIVWRLRAVFRTIRRVRHAEGFGEKLDEALKHFPKDIVEESISRAGSERPAQQSLTRLTFRTTPGVIVLTLLVSAALFYMGFARPDIAPSDKYFPGLDTGTVVLIKLGILALCLYTLIYHLANFTTIDGSELVTMSPLFQQRYFDLTRLTRFRLNSNGYYVLRFSDGKTARILKYVTGHDELVRAFEIAVAANQESACRNFPKSKRSVAG